MATRVPFTVKGIMGRAFRGLARNILTGLVIKPITTAFSVIFMWGFHAIMRMSKDEGNRIIKQIANTYYNPPSEWMQWIATYINNMTGSDITVEEIKEKGATGVASPAVKAFSENVMTSLLNTIAPPGEATMATGRDNAEAFMSVNMQFQMNSWLLHLLGDMGSFGMFKSLKDLPNAISWSFGIGWLSWLVMGTPFREAIATPLEWRYKKELRTSRVTDKEACDLHRAKEMGIGEWNEEMERKGWRSEDFKRVYDLGERRFSDSDLRDGLFSGYFTEQQVIEELRWKGLSDKRAKTQIAYWKHERWQNLLEDFHREAEDAYIDNRLDRTELRKIAGYLTTVPEEVDLYEDIANMKMVKAKTLTKADIRSALDKGVIGIADARGRLKGKGYSDRDTDILIRDWTTE